MSTSSSVSLCETARLFQTIHETTDNNDLYIRAGQTKIGIKSLKTEKERRDSCHKKQLDGPLHGSTLSLQSTKSQEIIVRILWYLFISYWNTTSKKKSSTRIRAPHRCLECYNNSSETLHWDIFVAKGYLTCFLLSFWRILREKWGLNAHFPCWWWRWQTQGNFQ